MCQELAIMYFRISFTHNSAESPGNLSFSLRHLDFFIFSHSKNNFQFYQFNLRIFMGFYFFSVIMEINPTTLTKMKFQQYLCPIFSNLYYFTHSRNHFPREKKSQRYRNSFSHQRKIFTVLYLNILTSEQRTNSVLPRCPLVRGFTAL